jgi:hypothetical protein
MMTAPEYGTSSGRINLCEWQFPQGKPSQISLATGMLHIDSNQSSILIEIEHDTLCNLIGINRFTLTKMYIQGVCRDIIV